MTERLIDTHGYSDTLFPPANVSAPNDYYTSAAEYTSDGLLAKPLIPKHGNTLAVQLVVNGMKLQPCRPTSVSLPSPSSPHSLPHQAADNASTLGMQLPSGP